MECSCVVCTLSQHKYYCGGDEHYMKVHEILICWGTISKTAELLTHVLVMKGIGD